MLQGHSNLRKKDELRNGFRGIAKWESAVENGNKRSSCDKDWMFSELLWKAPRNTQEMTDYFSNYRDKSR